MYFNPFHPISLTCPVLLLLLPYLNPPGPPFDFHVSFFLNDPTTVRVTTIFNDYSTFMLSISVYVPHLMTLSVILRYSSYVLCIYRHWQYPGTCQKQILLLALDEHTYFNESLALIIPLASMSLMSVNHSRGSTAR